MRSNRQSREALDGRMRERAPTDSLHQLQRIGNDDAYPQNDVKTIRIDSVQTE